MKDEYAGYAGGCLSLKKEDWRRSCETECWSQNEDYICHRQLVFYKHDDDTSKHKCSIWATAIKIDLQGLLTVPGTLGGEKGMTETRVEWTEFTWLLITYVWVIFICTHCDTPPSLKKLRVATHQQGKCELASANILPLPKARTVTK